MVGVPAFSMTWRSMPSVRIGWPLPCRACIQRMKREPMATTTQLRRHQRHAGAEGQVAQQVEDGDVVVVLARRR